MLIKRILSQALIISFFGFFHTTPVLAKSPDPVSSQPASGVLYWNEVAYHAFGGTGYQHSLMAARINAMVHLAIHDALNGIEEKYSRFAFSGKDVNADPLAAA